MAPTLRTGRRHSNLRGDTEHQFKDDATNAQESASSFDVEDEVLRRAISGLLGRDEDEDEGEDEGQDSEGSEDEDEEEGKDGRTGDRTDTGVPLLRPIPHSPAPQPPPLQPPPPNPISAPGPPPKKGPPGAAPPPQQPLPPSISIPPQELPTGISENVISASPSSARPRRTTLSAALPTNTSDGQDSDDEDEDGDDDDSDDDTTTPPPTRRPQSTFSTSTRSILSLTPAVPPPKETQSTDKDGQRSSVGRDNGATFTTSAPAQKTGIEMTTAMTGIPGPSGVADQSREAVRTSGLSPGGEKAVIASATIGGFIILLALAWFFWRRSSKRKSAGRKSSWPSNFPSREIFDGPRRVSSKVGEKFTSMKGHFRPGTLGWCSIDDDDDAPMKEKSAAPPAANAGSLLERRLGASTPQRVTVNPYGVIFRKPKRDSSLSDIFMPAGKTPSPPSSSEMPARQTPSPPSSTEIRIPIVRTPQTAAAAHLENARKSVNAGAHNAPRTPRTPKTPLRRNTRMSDVSSLSSGFGDGDIVIIQPPTAAAAARSAHPSVIDSNVNLVAVRDSPERKSFGSRFSRNRDTVLTNASEDLRPRFRSISSWVGQQSRRTKRAAASKNEDGVPNVPDLLPEQGFDMMMPDGQEPRRVDSSMWKKK